MSTAQDKPWYIVAAVTLLALGFAAAAFWLLAFTSVDTGTAFAFLTPALLIVGFLTGQAVPSAVTSVLNRATVTPPDSTAAADQAYMVARAQKRAEVDTQLAAQAQPPAS